MAQLRADVHAGFEAIDRGAYEDYTERTTKSLAKVSKSADANGSRKRARRLLIDSITGRFPVLAGMPGVGRASDVIKPGLRTLPAEITSSITEERRAREA